MGQFFWVVVKSYINRYLLISDYGIFFEFRLFNREGGLIIIVILQDCCGYKMRLDR